MKIDWLHPPYIQRGEARWSSDMLKTRTPLGSGPWAGLREEGEDRVTISEEAMQRFFGRIAGPHGVEWSRLFSEPRFREAFSAFVEASVAQLAPDGSKAAIRLGPVDPPAEGHGPRTGRRTRAEAERAGRAKAGLSPSRAEMPGEEGMAKAPPPWFRVSGEMAVAEKGIFSVTVHFSLGELPVTLVPEAASLHDREPAFQEQSSESSDPVLATFSFDVAWTTAEGAPGPNAAGDAVLRITAAPLPDKADPPPVPAAGHDHRVAFTAPSPVQAFQAGSEGEGSTHHLHLTVHDRLRDDDEKVRLPQPQQLLEPDSPDGEVDDIDERDLKRGRRGESRETGEERQQRSLDTGEFGRSRLPAWWELIQQILGGIRAFGQHLLETWRGRR